MSNTNEKKTREYRDDNFVKDVKLLEQTEEVFVYAIPEAAEFYHDSVNCFEFYSDDTIFKKRFKVDEFKNAEYIKFGIPREIFKKLISLLDRNGIIDIDDKFDKDMTDLLEELENENLNYDSFYEISNYAYGLYLYNWDAHCSEKEDFKKKLKDIKDFQKNSSHIRKLLNITDKHFEPDNTTTNVKDFKFYIKEFRGGKKKSYDNIEIPFKELDQILLKTVYEYLENNRALFKMSQKAHYYNNENIVKKVIRTIFEYNASVMEIFNNPDFDIQESNSKVAFTKEFLDFIIEYMMIGGIINPVRRVYTSKENKQKGLSDHDDPHSHYMDDLRSSLKKTIEDRKII